MVHRLYETGDIDTPLSVQDRNGEVVLALCRVCGQAEADFMPPQCPGEQEPR
jgi:hypothetical protein